MSRTQRNAKHTVRRADDSNKPAVILTPALIDNPDDLPPDYRNLRDAAKRQAELDQAKAEFFARGGTIEQIERGVSGGEYQSEYCKKMQEQSRQKGGKKNPKPLKGHAAINARWTASRVRKGRANVIDFADHIKRLPRKK